MNTYLLIAAILLGTPADWVREGRDAEALGRYSEAVSAYSRVLSEAPRSGWARSARTRLDYLRLYDDAGFEPLRRFEFIKRQYAELGSAEAIERAQEILKEYPDAAIIPPVLLWLGGESVARAGKPGEGQKYYRMLVEKYPEHELAPIALQRIGKLLEEQSRYREAEVVYRELENRYPNLVGTKNFPSRRIEAVKGFWRQFATRASWAVLGIGAGAFFLLGGYRVRRNRFWEQALPKAGFFFLLGVAPAAFLWVYDDRWSPSLTAMGLSFSAYAFVLGGLAARRYFRGGAVVRLAEKIVFAVLVPLALLILIIDGFELWAAFYL